VIGLTGSSGKVAFNRDVDCLFNDITNVNDFGCTGQATFFLSPHVPDPVSDNDTASKGYVDTAISQRSGLGITGPSGSLLVSLGNDGYTFGQLYRNDSTFTFKKITSPTTSINLGGSTEIISVSSDSTTVQTELYKDKLNFLNTSSNISFLSQDSTTFCLNAGTLEGKFQGPKWYHYNTSGERINSGLGYTNSQIISGNQTVATLIPNWNELGSFYTVLIKSDATGDRNITFPAITLQSGSEYQTVSVINCSTTDWTVTANNDIYGHALTAETTYIIPKHENNKTHPNQISFRSIKTGSSTYAWIAF
jgi:hypothetical protein